LTKTHNQFWPTPATFDVLQLATVAGLLCCLAVWMLLCPATNLPAAASAALHHYPVVIAFLNLNNGHWVGPAQLHGSRGKLI